MPGPPPNFAALLRERRGFLATVGKDGGPHLIPICFTWAGDVIWTAIDGKPKRSDEMQRLTDVGKNPNVAFTVDRWDEDWSRLSWLQARGKATVISDTSETEKAYAALRAKYRQYNETPLEGPVIRIEVDRWVGWSAS
jgi:PPOX class probable F420-dependent enzyme